MERRAFIRNTAIAALTAKSIILSTSQAAAMGLGSIINVKPSAVDPALIEPMKNLLSWMKDHGWGDVIKKITGNDFNRVLPDNDSITKEFTSLSPYPGCDDFVGSCLISPGKPQESLLYHLLASPRVRLSNHATDDDYPSLEQLDLLENFIYSLQTIESKDINKDRMVLAIFAYEYRPACKTPHEFYADMVFSRTGFARIGTKSMAKYDKVNRCFSNKPDDPNDEKEIAVTPARYGLFLAERLSYNDVSNNAKANNDKKREFLLPIRKIFNNDPIIQGYELSFEESHLTERLHRIFKSDLVIKSAHVNFRINESPFKRISSSSITSNGIIMLPEYDQKLVELSIIGSSVLLSSFPKPLVYPASQRVGDKNERLRVKVNEHNGESIKANRRYTTFKLTAPGDLKTDAIQLILGETIYNRRVTDYRSPRNEPMFVNMRDIVDETTGKHVKNLDETIDNLITETNKSHWVGLYDDNICDGCVLGKITKIKDSQFNPPQIAIALSELHLLPAFSVVTAPDFFPLAESYDMEEYKDLFLNGGTRDMSIGRLPANPNIQYPFKKESAAFPLNVENSTESALRETMLAVVSSHHNNKGKNPGISKRRDEAESLTRSNFLPDSATLFFYPGWDLTYSADNKDKDNQMLYYSTMGLGSPFVEDSKLCAAANGMWAATSPDSSRTFWATIDPVKFRGIAPTTLPLLDSELGYHKNATALKTLQIDPTYGWDGEQGPYLYQEGNSYLVSGTDINRSNYVANALDNKFDMSQLRKITISEVRNRVACLKKCYQKIDIRRNQVWLVGAEKLNESNKIACLPPSLLSNGATMKVIESFNVKPEYVYMFTQPKDKKKMFNPIKNSKRITHEPSRVYLCLVNKNEIKVARFRDKKNWAPEWM